MTDADRKLVLDFSFNQKEKEKSKTGNCQLDLIKKIEDIENKQKSYEQIIKDIYNIIDKIRLKNEQ